jgi:hypothetical protein
MCIYSYVHTNISTYSCIRIFINTYTYIYIYICTYMYVYSGPKTRMCHICGRQYGLHSFDIHLKQCKELWIAREVLDADDEV